MNRNYSVCNIKIDTNNYLKDRVVCKSCYNKNRRKSEIITSHQQTKVENVNNNRSNVNNPSVSTNKNHSYVVTGPRNVGKIYYMLKILEKIGNKRPIHILTRSPNQYPNYETNFEIEPIDKYKGSVILFDDMLGARNSSQIDDFFYKKKTWIFKRLLH